MPTYTVLLIRSDEGYAVGCPALPGCWSQGQTEAEALTNIVDAIQEWVAVGDAPTAPPVPLDLDVTEGDEVQEIKITI